MISRETENVRSAKEVDEAFRAITDGGKQLYVTEQELYQVKNFLSKFLFKIKERVLTRKLPSQIVVK